MPDNPKNRIVYVRVHLASYLIKLLSTIFEPANLTPLMITLSRCTLFLYLSLFTSVLYAQQPDWRSYYEDNNLTIEVHSVSCHLAARGTHQQILYIQYKNKTNTTIDVSFNRKVWYDDQCIGCNNEAESKFILTIPPLGNISGSCENGPKDKRLSIFQYSLDAVTDRRLTNFELSDIQVTLH